MDAVDDDLRRTMMSRYGEQLADECHFRRWQSVVDEPAL